MVNNFGQDCFYQSGFNLFFFTALHLWQKLDNLAQSKADFFFFFNWKLYWNYIAINFKIETSIKKYGGKSNRDELQ